MATVGIKGLTSYDVVNFGPQTYCSTAHIQSPSPSLSLSLSLCLVTVFLPDYMRPSLPRGHTKRCTRPSVRLPVPLHTICWKSESRRNFKCGGDMAMDTSNRGSEFEVTGNENIKIVFRAYLRENRFDLHHQAKTLQNGHQMSSNTFYQLRHVWA